MHTENQLPPKVIAALERGQTIEAIKLLRQSTGLGLKEAKDVIDAHLNHEPYVLPTSVPPAIELAQEVLAALQRGDKIEAIRLFREKTGRSLEEAKAAVEFSSTTPRASDSAPRASDLAPGEVPKSSGFLGWLIIAAIVGLLAYFFLPIRG